MRTYMEAPPQSDERKRAWAEMEAMRERRMREVPAERHQLRMTALYVDPDPAGTGWCRPCQRARNEARDFVSEAATDYALLYHHLRNNSASHPDPEFFRDFQAWVGRPVLPAPEWPSFDLAAKGTG
jgi:hypothetical protein